MDKMNNIELLNLDSARTGQLLDELRDLLEHRMQDDAGDDSAELFILDLQESTAEYREKCNLLLAVEQYLMQHGLSLEPGFEFSEVGLHLVLDGPVSIRLLVGHPPFLLEGVDQEEGYTYDAYACLSRTDSKSYQLHGFMLHEAVREITGTAGLAYIAPLVEADAGLEQLQATAVARQASPPMQFAEGGAADEAKADLEQALTQQEEAWERIEQLVYEHSGAHADMPADLSAVLHQSPLLTQRYTHLLEFMQLLSELPASAYQEALAHAEAKHADLVAKVKALQKAESGTAWFKLVQFTEGAQRLFLYAAGSMDPGYQNSLAAVRGEQRSVISQYKEVGTSKETPPFSGGFEKIYTKPLSAEFKLKCVAVFSDSAKGQVTPGPVVNLIIECDPPQVLPQITVLGINPFTGECGDLPKDTGSAAGSLEPTSIAWLAAEGVIEIWLTHEGEQYLVDKLKLG